MKHESLHKALHELKSLEKKKFDQTVDLIVNLKNIDMKKDQVNAIVHLPHKIKDKKVCAFLSAKSKAVDTITPPEFAKYKEKKALKNLVKEYDYFIAAAPLMPSIAAAFGKVLGPTGKMPSPQLGIIGAETDAAINQTLEKIAKSVKVRMKEPSIKLVAGKESMPEEKIIENAIAIYQAIENALPKKRENVRSVMIKLTMSKPTKVEF